MVEHKKFEFSTPMAVVFAGIVVACAILYTNAHPGAAAANMNGRNLPANANVQAPSVDDHIIGSPDAPIVFIEYSDFQCPYCTMVYPTIKNIVDSSNGQIAWVMRSFPLKAIHPEANPAANAAECIAEQLGNEGFWRYTETVFGNQNTLSAAYSRSLAKQFGADMTRYDSCINSSKYQNKIDAEMQDAMNSGGQGTPFTVVYQKGGVKQVPVSGAVPQSVFQSVIDELK